MWREDDPDDPIFRIDEPERPWFSLGDAWSWLFPLLGLLLFECFANPGVSVAVACLKFGYADMRTAFWLQNDPLPHRGRTMASCYIARGFLVSGGWGFFFLLILTVLEPLFKQNNNNPFQVLESLMIGTLIVMFTGAFIGGLLGLVAMRSVSTSGLRIWMDPTIHKARKERRWTEVCIGRRNQFRRMCIWLLMLCLMWLLPVSLGAIGSVVDPKQIRNPLVARLFGAAFAFLILGTPAVYGIVVTARAWRHSAEDPEDCWGDSPAGVPVAQIVARDRASRGKVVSR